MKRKLAMIAGFVAVVITILIWRSGQEGAGSSSSARWRAENLWASAIDTVRPDPQMVRGSLTGTITDEATKAPIEHARVCASGRSDDLPDELLRELSCVDTDEQGHYTLPALYAAVYHVSASERTYRPQVHHPRRDHRSADIQLAPGQHKTGIDVALRRGGVEVSGVVSDLTGGQIARARIYVTGDDARTETGTVMSETDDQGAFKVWVDRGGVQIEARAEGYADSSESVHAPGEVKILLTPESSVSGTVVDAASGQLVPNARVIVGASEWGSMGEITFTNTEGRFWVRRLNPGRVVAVARTEHGYGRTEGSTLIGLGQHVDGLIVKLFPSRRVEGKVLISAKDGKGTTICEEPEVSFRSSDRWFALKPRADHSLDAVGMFPGTYIPEIACRGYRSHDTYDPLTIADTDVTGLVWAVESGATLRGRVFTRSGDPVEGARVWARTTGGAAREKIGWGADRTTRAGQYALTGLLPGRYEIRVSSENGIGLKDGYKVDVSRDATIEKDLVLEDSGTIKGTVVDSQGKASRGVDVTADATNGESGGNHKSDDVGSFTIDGLRPGEYRVTAERSWSEVLRKPGTTDDVKQGERVTVRANQTTTVKLVVEPQSAWIKGVVIDAQGKPVPDAFVSAARESDAEGSQRSSVQATRWSWNDKPVITNTDGTFFVGKLTPGEFTVRAYRKGGGESVAEHVGTGTTVRLHLKPTGSIEGTVTRTSALPETFAISVRDLLGGFWRDEQFYMTRGHFIIRDVPTGHFQVTVETAGAQKKIDLDLAEGEARTGVTIELEPLITLTGRIVELGTQKPVAGLRMYASEASLGEGVTISRDDEKESISDDAGRFTIKNAPRGKLLLQGWPKGRENDYQYVSTIRTVEGSGVIDLGDLPVLKKRIKQGDPVGELGINFAEQRRDTQPDKREYKVSYIDPTGPASNAGLKLGDIVISIDGIDITGASSSHAPGLMRAAPGTTIALGLLRGAKVIVVLAAP